MLSNYFEGVEMCELRYNFPDSDEDSTGHIRRPIPHNITVTTAEARNLVVWTHGISDQNPSRPAQNYPLSRRQPPSGPGVTIFGPIELSKRMQRQQTLTYRGQTVGVPINQQPGSSRPSTSNTQHTLQHRRSVTSFRHTTLSAPAPAPSRQRPVKVQGASSTTSDEEEFGYLRSAQPLVVYSPVRESRSLGNIQNDRVEFVVTSHQNRSTPCFSNLAELEG